MSVWSSPPGSTESALLNDAWNELLVGRIESARETAIRLQGRYPEWLDPMVLEGFTYYSENRWLPALQTFQRVLQRNPDHIGALYGMLLTYTAQGDDLTALQYGEQLVRLRPNDARLMDFVRAVELRAVEQMLRQARRARQMGRIDEAENMYRQVIARIPENVEVLLEYAGWLENMGKTREAIAYYQLAYNQRPGDPEILRRYAPLLVQAGRCDQANPLIADLKRLEPGNEEWQVLDERCRGELQRSQYHAEYEKVRMSPAITRGQLATVLCLEFPELMEEKVPVRPVILEDVRDHWASRFIQRVVQLGLIPLYSPHRFDPEQTVNRGEFAQVIYLVLRHLGRDAMIRDSGHIRIRDVSPLHRLYRSIVTSVKLGLLKLDEQGMFHADRPVSGADAIRAIQGLRSLIMGSG